MKQTIRWILVFTVASAVGSLVTYRIAYHRGYESGYNNATLDEIGRSRFGESIAFFAALKKIRAGDILGATDVIERSCLDSAHIFYKAPTPVGEVSEWGRAQGLATSPGAEMTKKFAEALMKYRAVYRTNSTDWDDMERKLVAELAKVK
jgi:hypothetical protein